MTKKAKIILLSIIACVLVVSATVTGILLAGRSPKDEPQNNTVTLTFDSQGGSAVAAKILERGAEIGELEASKLEGSTFDGWFYDPELTQPVYQDDLAEQDRTLYAAWILNTVQEEVYKPTEAYLNDVGSNYVVSLASSREITPANLSEFLLVTSDNGNLPTGFSVTKNGEYYLVTPVGNYQPGCRYNFTLTGGATFADYSADVRELTIRVHKEAVSEATVNPSMKYLSMSDLTPISTDGKGYLVTGGIIESLNIVAGDTLMLGDGTDRVYDGIRFVKVAEVYTDTSGGILLVESADFGDVIEEIDVCFTEDITNDFTSSLNPDEMVAKIMEGDAVKAVNKLMAATLLTSRTFRNNYTNPLSADSDSDYDPYDFHGNASLTETLVKLSLELAEDLTVTVSIGAAENDNFRGGPDPDYWCAVTFTFVYDGEVGDNIKVKCTFEFTQYLNISLQGYHEGNLLSSVKFDYAVNIYSQTEVAFTALMCSQSADDEEEEDYFDITEEMSNLLEDDDEEEEDPESLLGQLLSMMDDDGDYIRLLTVPFYECNKPVPPVFPILSLNLELDFVFDVKFGAGISSRFVNLDAVQIGICNDKEGGKLQTYKHNLSGADRFSLDVEVCGYLGFKAGLEGQFGISFVGLDKLGEVGLSIETGTYIDFYGYARFHMQKSTTYSGVYKSISGGIFIDIGLYLDVAVYAKSDIFKVKAEAEIIGKKWSLITVGSKDLLLYLDPYEAKVLMTDGYVSVDDLPTVTGCFIDLTTGELTKHKVIGWDELRVGFFVSYLKARYTADGSLEGLVINNPPYSGNYVVVNVSFSYPQSSLSFSGGTNVNLTLISPKAGIEVGNIDVLGEKYNVDYYMAWEDGEPTYLGSVSVWGGNTAGGASKFFDFNSLNRGMSVVWDKDPNTPITEDTNLTFRIRYPLTSAVFTYYDTETDEFVVAEYYISILEPATPPVTGNGDKVTFLNWHSTPGPNNALSFDYVGNDLYLCDPDEFLSANYQNGIYLYGNAKAGDVRRIGRGITPEAAFVNYEHSDNYYYMAYPYVTYLYTAQYEFANQTVTLHYEDNEGTPQTEVTQVRWGSTYSFPSMSDTKVGYFSGFAASEGGNVDWGTGWTVNIQEDREFWTVYTDRWYSVYVERWDESTGTFHDDYYQPRHGSILTEDILQSMHAGDMLAPGVSVGTVYWCYQDLSNPGSGLLYLNDETRVTGHMKLFQIFERRIHLTIQAPEGATILSLAYAVDCPINSVFYEPEYTFTVTDYNIVSYPDDNFHHVFLGYRDRDGNLLEPGKTYTFTEPTTLTAEYRDEPIYYDVTILTNPWPMDDGKTYDSQKVKKADLESYIANFLETYENRTYEDMTVGDSIFTFTGISVEVLDDFQLVKINFQTTARYIDCTTTFVYGNGQEDNVEVLPLHTTILSLPTPYYPTTPGLTVTFLGWDTDGDDLVDIEPGGSYTTLGDNTVRAVWNKVYTEYTATFILDLDEGSINLGTKTFHYGDSITAPALPAEYQGWVLDGWHTSDSYYTVMPEHDITLHSDIYQVFVSYEIDGVAYTAPTPTPALSTVNLLPLPEAEAGISYSDWYCEGIEITDGTFFMPEHNVVFSTHKSIESHTVAFYVDGEMWYEESVPYGTVYHVADLDPNNRENYIFMGWISEQVTVRDGCFTMPLTDVRLDARFEEYSSSPIVLYYLDGELMGYTRALMGTSVDPIEPEPDPEERQFSGWCCDTTPFIRGQIPITRPVTVLYGYYTAGTSFVDFSIGNELTDATYNVRFAGNPGDTVSVPHPAFLSDAGWMNLNTEEYLASDTFTFGEEPVSFQGTLAEQNKHTVYFEAITYYYTADTTPITARAGERVTLPSVTEAVSDSQMTSTGWLTADGIEIEVDGSGVRSFVMPDRDLYFYLYDIPNEDNGVSIRLHVIDAGTEQEILVGTYQAFPDAVVNTDILAFAVDGYTLGDWRFNDGRSAVSFTVEDEEEGYDIFAVLSVENVNIERCYLDGELVAMFAKVGETYITPAGREPGTLNGFALPEKEGYDYLGWLNFINGYSQGKAYHFYPLAIDTDLYNYSYRVGETPVEVLLYNEDLYGEEPFHTNPFLSASDKIRLPLWDTDLYDVTVLATRNGEAMPLTLESDELSSYVTLPSDLEVQDTVTVAFYLTAKE